MNNKLPSEAAVRRVRHILRNYIVYGNPSEQSLERDFALAFTEYEERIEEARKLATRIQAKTEFTGHLNEASLRNIVGDIRCWSRAFESTLLNQKGEGK